MEDSQNSLPHHQSDSESSSTIQDMPADLSMSSSSSVIKPIEIKPDYPESPTAAALDNRAMPMTLAKLANKIQGDNNTMVAADLSKKKDDAATAMSPAVALTRKVEDSGKEAPSSAPSPQMGFSPSGFTPKVSPPVNEKKERDESWKKYLTR